MLNTLKIISNFFPSLCLFYAYKRTHMSNAEKKGYDLARIIESHYQDILLKNSKGVKLEGFSASKTRLGYKVVFKLPLAFDTNLKLKDLENVLDKFDDKYFHKIYNSSILSNSINNKILVIHVVDKNIANDLFYRKKKRS